MARFGRHPRPTPCSSVTLRWYPWGVGNPDDFFRADEEPHPRARLLLTDASEILWSPDVGPLNSDRGRDAFVEFSEWRSEHPKQRLDACLQSTLTDWGVRRYDETILDTQVIEQQIADEGVDFYQEVYVLDETLIASALAQLFFEGGIDGPAKPTVRLAVARQLHPLVLRRLFDDNAAGDRVLGLREVLRLLDAAGDVLPADRRQHVARVRRVEQASNHAHARASVLAACPWPAGSVLSRQLPTGTRLLLHLFEMARYDVDDGYGGKPTVMELPAFYVLDWRGEGLPSEAELEGTKPADAWTFSLELPAAIDESHLEARRASLELVLEPTGLTKAPVARPVISRVQWARLDEYLAYNYDQ